jgi:hypothetical protein
VGTTQEQEDRHEESRADDVSHLDDIDEFGQAHPITITSPTAVHAASAVPAWARACDMK